MGWNVLSETRLNGGDADIPQMVRLSDGSLVVGYTVATYFPLGAILGNGPTRFEAVRIDVSGSVSRNFSIDNMVARSDTSFGISAGADRTFTFSWTDPLSGTDGPTDVKAQRYVGANLKSGPVMRPSDSLSGVESQSDVEVMSNRMTVLVWTEATASLADRSGTSIRGQLFTNASFPSGGTFQVNTQTTGNQTDARVTELEGSRFLVTWRDAETFRGQMFATDPFKTGVTRIGKEIDLGADFFSATARSGGGFSALLRTEKGTDTQAYTSKGSLVGFPTVSPSVILSTGDGRHIDEISLGGLGVNLHVVTDDGEVSGTQIFGGGSLAVGMFRFAVPFGDGLLAVLRQTDTREGLLSTPISEIYATIVDLTKYTGDATNERIFGGARADTLDGGGGNDLIEGRGGDDTLRGGDGDDNLNGGPGIDTLDGGAGNDTLSTSDPGDVLIGGGGDDFFLLSGAAAGIFITTGMSPAAPVAPATQVSGGDGTDTLLIEGGKDVKADLSGIVFEQIEGLAVAAPATVGITQIKLDTSQFGVTALSESFRLTGLDQTGAREMLRLAVTSGNPFSMRDWSFADWGGQGERIVITGSAADDGIEASAWNDVLRGKGGEDVLAGQGRADTVSGGRGADTVLGGGGADLLTGGRGADTFVLTSATDSGLRRRADTITDFTPGRDQVDLAEVMIGGSFIGSHRFDAAGQVRYSGDRLQGDLDGDGLADWSIRLLNAPDITAADILFG